MQLYLGCTLVSNLIHSLMLSNMFSAGGVQFMMLQKPEGVQFLMLTNPEGVQFLLPPNPKGVQFLLPPDPEGVQFLLPIIGMF